jgi:hypothetical protein
MKWIRWFFWDAPFFMALWRWGREPRPYAWMYKVDSVADWLILNVGWRFHMISLAILLIVCAFQWIQK